MIGSGAASPRVTVVQMRSRIGQMQENRERIRQAVEREAAVGTDLVVLPELCDTGYTTQPEIAEFAGPLPGPTSDLLCKLAARHDITIVTALAVRTDEDRIQDTSLIVTPDGLVASGVKSFLWDGEADCFDPGSRDGLPAVADTPIGRVGAAICYEIGFPEVARTLALRDADIVAVPSAFGQRRLHAWKLLTRVRALENGCFLLAANMVGPNREAAFAGHSAVIDPHGQVLASLAQGEGVLSTEIDLEELARARAAIPYLRDLRSSGAGHSPVAERDVDVSALPTDPMEPTKLTQSK